MSITGEVKQYGEIAAEQGKAALVEVRRSFYAALGAGDVMRAQAAEQRKQFNARAQGLVQDLRARAQELPSQARVAPADLRRSVEGYVQATGEQAGTVYAELTRRGEKVVNEFRKDPRVQRVIIRSERAVDTVEDTLEDLLDEVDDDVKDATRDAKKGIAEGAETTRSSMRKMAARNTTARKSTAGKSTTSKSTTSKSTTGKSTAGKSTTGKSTAATRRASTARRGADSGSSKA